MSDEMNTNIEPTAEPTPDPIICDVCGYSAKNKRALAIHRGVQHKDLKGTPQVVVQTSQPVAKPVQAAPMVPPTPVLFTTEGKMPEIMPMDCKALGITEILEGAKLRLNGPHYTFNGQAISGPETAINVIVLVNNRWMDKATSAIYLKARTEVGQQEWILAEQAVLNGVGVELLALKAREVPAAYVPPIPEEIQPEEGPSEAEKMEMSSFLQAVELYAEARDTVAKFKAEFAKVSEEQRQNIINFLLKHGVESEEGKGDARVLLEGWNVLYTFTPGQTIIKRDEAAISAWLTQNNMFWAFKPVIDWEKWEALKVMGQVPADFIKEVEVPKTLDDDRKLLVKKVDDK
jgi:hypothetical protein